VGLLRSHLRVIGSGTFLLVVVLAAGLQEARGLAVDDRAASQSSAVALPSLLPSLPLPSLPLPSLPIPSHPLPTVSPSLPLPSVSPSLPLPSIPIPSLSPSIPLPSNPLATASPSPSTATRGSSGPGGPSTSAATTPGASSGSASAAPSFAGSTGGSGGPSVGPGLVGSGGNGGAGGIGLIGLPPLAIAVPLVVLLGVLLMQIAGGAVWLPFMRRWLGRLSVKMPVWRR